MADPQSAPPGPPRPDSLEVAHQAMTRFFAETESDLPRRSLVRQYRPPTVDAVLANGRKYQVTFEGTYWTAIPLDSKTKLQVGDVVTIMGREGNELIVSSE